MPSRRLFLAAAVAFAIVPAAVRAAPADTPAAFVTAVFAPVTAGDGTSGGSAITDRETRARWFTGAVVKLWNAADAKAEKDGDIGPVDFDLLTASQDPRVGRVAIEPRETRPDAATVRVDLFATKKARPGAKPYSSLELVLKRENGGWRIDDVKEVSGAYTWTLRGLLMAR